MATNHPRLNSWALGRERAAQVIFQGPDTTEEELADHCASSGEVASVELLTRGRAQRPSGSAVVEYRYAEAAAAAVDALEGTELDGRDLRVRAYFSN